MNISIATFISGNETFSDDFLGLLEYLRQESHSVKAYVFSEKYNSEIPNNIMQICMPQTTKYLRIMRLVQDSPYESILFVDNDITVNKLPV